MTTKTEMHDLIVFEMRKAEGGEENSQDIDEQKFMHVADEEGDQNDGFIEEQSVDNSKDEDAMEKVDVKPDLKKLNAPRRYMLFDELVAIVVDYDQDGTPIVEFALADGENDDKLPVECGICPEVMPKSKLAKHLKNHKVPGTNRFACIYCDETYKDYKYLAGHARRHMGIRPYVCEPCKLYFSTKQDLRVHNQRRHHTKEHVCELCGKGFAQNTMLKRHRESTHEKKRRFQCEHCPKAYYKNFSLQEHVRAVHMGKRRMLVCPFCGMQCRDAHKMARHRKQYHLSQKQFVCEVCHEEFTDINYFDAHKRSIQCRNNTRRRMEEDHEDENLDAYEPEHLEEEELQDVVEYQNDPHNNNIEDEEMDGQFPVIINDVDHEAHLGEGHQQQHQQDDEVIIYELDVDEEEIQN